VLARTIASSHLFVNDDAAPGYHATLCERLTACKSLGATARRRHFETPSTTGWLAVKERHGPMHQLSMR
jgi:hypothetical protein